MSPEQLYKLLQSKLSAPTSADAPGMMVTVDGSRTDRAAAVTDTVVIGGNSYKVRVSGEGAEGFITIAPNQIIIDGKAFEMWLGDKRVSDIYVGTTHVYNRAAVPDVLYNGALIPGIAWRGNWLPRENYKDFASYVISDENENLVLYVSGGGESYNFNAHVITREPVTVPSTCTRLNVKVRKYAERSGGTIRMNFGLLPANASNSLSTAQGGALTTLETISSDTYVTKSLTVPSALKGRSDLYCIVNVKDCGGIHRDLLVNKVWFD